MVFKATTSLKGILFFTGICLVVLLIAFSTDTPLILAAFTPFYGLFMALHTTSHRYQIEDRHLKIKSLLEKKTISLEEIRSVELKQASLLQQLFALCPPQYLKVYYQKYEEANLFADRSAEFFAVIDEQLAMQQSKA